MHNHSHGDSAVLDHPPPKHTHTHTHTHTQTHTQPVGKEEEEDQEEQEQQQQQQNNNKRLCSTLVTFRETAFKIVLFDACQCCLLLMSLCSPYFKVNTYSESDLYINTRPNRCRKQSTLTGRLLTIILIN